MFRHKGGDEPRIGNGSLKIDLPLTPSQCVGSSVGLLVIVGSRTCLSAQSKKIALRARALTSRTQRYPHVVSNQSPTWRASFYARKGGLVL